MGIMETEGGFIDANGTTISSGTNEPETSEIQLLTTPNKNFIKTLKQKYNV